MSTLDQVKNLPQEPGIYQFWDKDGKLLYVGKAISLKKRVASYFQKKSLGAKTDLLVSKIADISHIKVFSEFEALLLEASLIRENQPFFNFAAKDDKSPIYIRITNDAIPIVETVRKPQKKKGEYIAGPFPSAKTTREVLRVIRRIFPYCHHKCTKKRCLFVHLGLCPYPYADKESATKYIKTIKNIKKLLAGGSKLLLTDLTREMQIFSKTQKFEEADAIKKQIQQLEYIQTTYHSPREFLEQPTLVDDLTLLRLKDLQTVLNLEKIPKRIECYDISNIGGKQATGSMVVFENGKPQKSEYRRFKIKLLNTPNDYEMLEQVLTRRFKNDWKIADVMIIDGGRGQLNAAAKVVNKFEIKTTLISIAKRLEEIYTTDNVLPISLPKESPARQLAQALRDEAHRFAITYHRLLRSKQFIG